MKKLIYLLASAILAGLLIGCTPTVSSCCMHSATDTSITKEATCTETGVKTTKCLECGEVLKTEDIDALGHNYDSEITTPATCTTKGVNTYTCTRCYDSFTEPVPTKDHEYDEWYEDHEALATVCSSCHETHNEWYVEGNTLHILKDVSTLDDLHSIELNVCVISIVFDYVEEHPSFDIDFEEGAYICVGYPVLVLYGGDTITIQFN